MTNCIFCDILRRKETAEIIHQDEQAIILLDKKPLFPGHALLIPIKHYETLVDIPASDVAPFFSKLQQIARVVKEGMGSEGFFVGMNNIVSQSVPHFHVHIVPRNKGDGLKGFFWPRYSYQAGEIEQVATRLKAKWQALFGDSSSS